MYEFTEAEKEAKIMEINSEPHLQKMRLECVKAAVAALGVLSYDDAQNEVVNLADSLYLYVLCRKNY